MAKSSKQLLRITKHGKFEQVEGEIVTVHDLKCFVFRQPQSNRWCVAEYSTGMRVFEAFGINMNKKQTLECARLTLKEKGPQVIKETIASKLNSLSEPANE